MAPPPDPAAAPDPAGPALAELAAAVGWLRDRREIADLLARYTRAIDRRDWDLLRTCYHPGALDHHTGFDGTAEDFVAFVEEHTAGALVTHHHIGQQHVEIDGDVARSEAYGISTHHDPDDPASDYTSGVRYVDRVERRDGVWRIAERFATRDWTRSDAGRFTDPAAPGPRGTQGPDDPLFQLPGWPPARGA